MTETAQPSHPKRDTGRIVLVAALALSLLLNAVAAGAALRFSKVRHEILGPEAGAAFFPREVRRDIGRALVAPGTPFRAAVQELVAARAQVVESAAARPFDRGRTEAAMTAFRARTDAALALAQVVILDVLERRATE